MLSGVYEIYNAAANKRYVGSTINLDRRWRDHLRSLNAGAHINGKLQNAWNKHGAGAFSFRPILTCAKSLLLFYEQQLLDKAIPEYNICVTAGSRLGAKQSLATRAKLSLFRTGKPLSEAHRASIGAANTGKKHSAETRAKIKAANTGKKQTPEQIAKLSLLRRGNKNSLGVIRSAATRLKISLAKRKVQLH